VVITNYMTQPTAMSNTLSD